MSAEESERVEVHRIQQDHPTDPAPREKRVPYDTNRATMSAERVENGRNWGDKLETVGTMKLVAFDARERREKGSYRDGFRVVADARFYMGRSADGAGRVRCSVWISARDGRYWAGNGYAGGYGYHKKSAALQSALESAGVALEGRIDGCGEEAMREALRAIGRACGYGRVPCTVVES